MPVSVTVKTLFNKARSLGTGRLEVRLSGSELYGLLLLICRDLSWQPEHIGLPKPREAIPKQTYYSVPPIWFLSHSNAPDPAELQKSIETAIALETDFGMYFSNLCSLHKRRLKFQRILSTQPKPTMDQVGTRGLLEYGTYTNQFLFNWLVWRKWIFDLDNRSGQETGYLFEPVLTRCLGGEAIDANSSPVKRIGENGEPKKEGRQIDCYVEDEKLAYEFKIRLTIAASGQGRWDEELSFPGECVAAGLRPVLIVLDPTTSNRFEQLRDLFLSLGGLVFVGEAAWSHIEERAGRTMARFVENYIKPALDAASEFDTAQLAPISMSWLDGSVVIRIGDKEHKIERE
ncbi:MAG: restriction endonuclease [Flavobacteriales bacterium]|nr:restriction endonuclease [Flavobacteriales bacterium]